MKGFVCKIRRYNIQLSITPLISKAATHLYKYKLLILSKLFWWASEMQKE